MKAAFFASSILLSFFGHEAQAEELVRPCHELKLACNDAGYKSAKDRADGIASAVCIKMLLDGQTPAGVSAKPEMISACKAKRAAQEAKIAKRRSKRR